MRTALCLFTAAALVTGCTSSKAPSTGRAPHPLVEHGLLLELPGHFGMPSSRAGAYEWTTNQGLTVLRVEGATAQALPGPIGGETVDYDREASFGPYPGTERRTQETLGSKRRIVWMGLVRAPRGRIAIKLVMIQTESPEAFGETFWQNLRGWFRAI